MKTYTEQCDAVMDLRILLNEVKRGINDAKGEHDTACYRSLRYVEERLKGIVNREIESRNAYPEHEAKKMANAFRWGK